MMVVYAVLDARVLIGRLQRDIIILTLMLERQFLSLTLQP